MIIKEKKQKVDTFFGKPQYDRGPNGYICFSGKKLVKGTLIAGYYFKFWGSKSWRFIPLKTMLFLATHYQGNIDYGSV